MNMSTSEAQAHDESFSLIMARFDGVDKDNKDIKDALDKHINDAFHPLSKTVGTHTTYWSLLIWIGSPFILMLIGWMSGLFKP
jgi:hypothetical protein